MLYDRLRRLAEHGGFCVRGNGTITEIKNEAGNKQQGKRYAQRVGIERPRPSSSPYGPGSIGLSGPARRILVLRRALVWIFRFSGAALEEYCPQHHTCRHLQELAFPVFKDGREDVS